MLVPAGAGEAELREKGSRFLASVFPADEAGDARAARDRARREHHDATHHVFAWRGLAGEDARFDDDGEPSGTAGRPCLGALEATGLRRAGLVVVRWFGGTELGTGGLARAYAAAARRAASGIPVRRVRRGRRVSVRHAYADTGPVSSVLGRSGAVRLAADWAGTATLELAVPEDEVDGLRRSLAEATSGRAEVEVRDGTVLVPLRG